MDDSVLSMDGDKTTKWSVTFIRANVLYTYPSRKASRGLVIPLLHRLMQGGERNIIRPCAVLSSSSLIGQNLTGYRW